MKTKCSQCQKEIKGFPNASKYRKLKLCFDCASPEQRKNIKGPGKIRCSAITANGRRCKKFSKYPVCESHRNTRSYGQRDFEDRKDMNVTGVYFISDGEFTKIGRAKNCASRLSDLQVANGRELKLVGVINCESDDYLARLIEGNIHKWIPNKYHVRGEWFNLEVEQINYLIDNHKELPKNGKTVSFMQKNRMAPTRA